MEMKLYVLVVLMETVRAVSGVSPEGAGCEEGWLNHGHFCYYLGLAQACTGGGAGCSHLQALQQCQHRGDARLASVWTREERDFITDVLLQPSLSSDQFAWFGLHGTPSNTWAYYDSSDVIMTGGVLTSSGGEPAEKASKCGAFKGTGNLVFWDCQAFQAQGFVCKKPLSRVFASSDLLNYTLPSGSLPPPRGAQLFERVWPPLLVDFPRSPDFLARDAAESETGCAFRCFNVRGCKAFQVTCISSDMCKTVSCSFYK